MLITPAVIQSPVRSSVVKPLNSTQQQDTFKPNFGEIDIVPYVLGVAVFTGVVELGMPVDQAAIVAADVAGLATTQQGSENNTGEETSDKPKKGNSPKP